MRSPLAISSATATPPLIPSLPSLLPGFAPPDSPQYLSDLALSTAKLDLSGSSMPQERHPIVHNVPGTILSPAYRASSEIGGDSGGNEKHSPAALFHGFGTETAVLHDLRNGGGGGGLHEQGSFGDEDATRNGEGRGHFSSILADVSSSCSPFCADYSSPPRLTPTAGGMHSKYNASPVYGTSSSTYSTPRRSPKLPAAVDLSLLTDPGLDLDIQDICADPALDADAPVFVPGGYFPG